MTYSIIGILAAIILLIINRDVICSGKDSEIKPTDRNYRIFLMGIMGYYVTDLLWGILEANRLTAVLFADTTVHFIAMAAAVMLWTRYVISYLDEQNLFSRFLRIAGILFMCFEAVVVAVNLFKPVLFWFDEEGAYHASGARYVTLIIQIILFFMTSVYTLTVTSKTQGTVKQRHMAIGFFGIAMVIFIAVQFFYPLLPFYAMGYMLGSCVLHSFVVEAEKEEYREELEAAIERDTRQKQELTESREALRDALKEAEGASKAKTVFLSNMSHEIRTPMNAIISLDRIAMKEPTASDKVKEYLEKIGSSAQHLLEIINDILDVSRIESGRMSVNNDRFSLSDSIDQINTIIGGQCRDKGLEYEYSAAMDTAGCYIGDAMKVRQIMINLLGNSVKFTPEGGKVSFTVKEGRRYGHKVVLIFEISDTGIGMSKEFMEHMYDAFSQEDASTVNKYGSTGLGMSITRSLVELMNGHIDVQSEKGKGTTFTVTIPFEEADGEPGQASTDKAAGQEGTGQASMDKAAQEHASETPGTAGEPVDLAGLRVLVAEDIDVNYEIMTLLLSDKNVQADRAENGKIAVQKFRDHEPGYYDAIFMDMRMPEMDGLEATRIIRAMDRQDAVDIPIIALTANAFDDDVQRSMQAGLNAHLSKPIEPDVMYRTLKSLVRK